MKAENTPKSVRPRLSIVIATYGAVNNIAVTFDSILRQQFSDYEVVVMDGGSTDGTIELLKKYETKFGSKLVWKSEPDQGIYDAMNKGIKNSRGDWLYFMGSGDTFIDENTLSVLSKQLDPAYDVIYGSVIIWGKKARVYDGKFSQYKLFDRNISHQAIFYKREVFDKLGNFEIKYHAFADYVFNIKWFNDSDIKHKYIDQVIANYETGGYSTQNRDKAFREDRTKINREYFPLRVRLVMRIYIFCRRIFTFLRLLLTGRGSEIGKIVREKYL